MQINPWRINIGLYGPPWGQSVSNMYSEKRAMLRTCPKGWQKGWNVLGMENSEKSSYLLSSFINIYDWRGQIFLHVNLTRIDHSEWFLVNDDLIIIVTINFLFSIMKMMKYSKKFSQASVSFLVSSIFHSLTETQFKYVMVGTTIIEVIYNKKDKKKGFSRIVSWEIPNLSTFHGIF